ncbi:MAG: S41 family peptidase [Paludibacter sp.]|jgi:carboxyl-terminal processing protease|nr:S41 family peptidase [Paludibacter sp.]
MKKTYLIISILLLSVTVSQADNARTFRISKTMSLFNAVFRELEINYVDTLDYDAMLKVAIDGMLDELDPYTVFMPEEEMDDLRFMTTGEYGGIGALIMKNGNEICVSEPYEGMPAQKNDVRAGDVFLEINGEKVEGMTVGQVSALLRGTPNTDVKLKLRRYGEKKPVVKEFKREKIQINSITYSAVVAPKTGYILLNDFTDNSALEFKNAVNEMIKSDGIENLIIDVRENGGGLVNEAVQILGYFLPKGTEVVKVIAKNPAANHSYKTPTEPLFPNMKLAVLVNNGSASASEILAGAIQDLDRGTIIGERTFGKGLVQNIRPLGYGANLKITTAKYYIPSGRCIQAIDYSHHNEDGSVDRVPDSLTTEFKTKNGRIVRDGGGIEPDFSIEDDARLNISYYLYAQNMYFNFVTQYVSEHSKVETPDKFELSDDIYKEFTDFVKTQNFKYVSQTQRYFDRFFEIAQAEGFDETAKSELDDLRSKIQPDIERDLTANQVDVKALLSVEIVKRYYFQRGEVQFALRNDKHLKMAIEKF